MCRYILMNLSSMKVYENLFWFLVIITLKIAVWLNVTSWSLVEIVQSFKETFCFLLQVGSWEQLFYNVCDYTMLQCQSLGRVYIYIYLGRFYNAPPRCPTPRLHCLLTSHGPSGRFLSFMAFLTPSIQFFFGLPRALHCSGIHLNATLGKGEYS
jgi:hypothetical protein